MRTVDEVVPGAAGEGSVRAVERALLVLEALSHRPDGATASELARATRLSVSTAHRLLVTLQGGGFAVFERSTFRWRVGRAAFFTGSAFADDRGPTAFALPVIRELGLAGGETVNLGRIENGRLVFLARFEPRAGRCSAPGVSDLPAHCSSIGKAILGSAKEPQLLVLTDPLPALTPKSIRSPSELVRQLGLAHAAGFAVDDEENTIGLRCVAAPIFDERRRPVAAISVAAPAERFPKHEVAIRGMMVAAAARRITYAIGGAEPKRA